MRVRSGDVCPRLEAKIRSSNLDFRYVITRGTWASQCDSVTRLGLQTWLADVGSTDVNQGRTASSLENLEPTKPFSLRASMRPELCTVVHETVNRT